MTAPYGSDSLGSARQPDHPYVHIPAKSAPLPKDKIDSIRAAVAEVDSGRTAPQNSSNVKVFVLFIVGRMSVVPVFLFVVFPKKAAEVVGPAVANTGKQLMLLSGTMMNLMARITENIAESFKPLERMATKIQEAITSSIQSSVESYKNLQKTLSKAFAQFSQLFTQGANQISKALAQLTDKAAYLKEFILNFGKLVKNDPLASAGFSNNETLNRLSPFVKMVQFVNQAIESQVENFTQKVQAGIKQVKEKVIEPVKQLAQAAVNQVQESAAAALASIQVATAPYINLAVTAGMAAKGIVEGQLKNFVQMAQSLSSKVQNAVEVASKAIYQAYQQVIVQHLVAPFMASLHAGWSRVATVQQKLWDATSSRVNDIARQLREDVKRLARRLQALFGAIQGWAQRKWKQEWLPALKEVPKKMVAISKLMVRFFIGFWRGLLFVLVELFHLMVALVRNFVQMIKEAFGEVVTQTKSWK